MQLAPINENRGGRFEAKACLYFSTVRWRGVLRHMYVWFALLLIWFLYSLFLVIPYITEMTSKNSENSIGNMFWRKRFNSDQSYQYLLKIEPDIDQTGQVKTGLQNGSILPFLAPPVTSPPAPRLCYDRVLNTGFGDRLSVYLTVAAAAATVSGEVYTFWEAKPIEGTCSVCDVSFDSVQQYVTWPPNLKILTKQKYHEIAMNCSGNIQYNTEGLLQSSFAFDGYTRWRGNA